MHLYCSVLISLGAERTLSGLRTASALENFVLGASAHSTSSHSSAFVLFCVKSGLIATGALENFVLGASAHSTY